MRSAIDLRTLKLSITKKAKVSSYKKADNIIL